MKVRVKCHLLGRDIAREAGVSKSTVSLVLRDSPLVHAETRVKVQAIEKLLSITVPPPICAR